MRYFNYYNFVSGKVSGERGGGGVGGGCVCGGGGGGIISKEAQPYFLQGHRSILLFKYVMCTLSQVQTLSTI